LPQTSGQGGLYVSTRDVGRKKKKEPPVQRREPPAPKSRPRVASGSAGEVSGASGTLAVPSADSVPTPRPRPAQSVAAADRTTSVPGPRGVTQAAPTAVAAVKKDQDRIAPDVTVAKAASVPGQVAAAKIGDVEVPNPRPRPTDARDGRSVKPANPPNPRIPQAKVTVPTRVVSKPPAPRVTVASATVPTPRPRPSGIDTQDGVRVPTPREKPERKAVARTIVPPRSFGEQFTRAPEFRQQGTPPAKKSAPTPAPAPRPAPKATPPARPAEPAIAKASTVPTPRPRPTPTAKVPPRQAATDSLAERYFKKPEFQQGGRPRMSKSQLRALYDEYYKLPRGSSRRAEIDAILRQNVSGQQRLN
jgi:hypothetical protein